MFDLKAIRQNPDYFIHGWNRRGLDGAQLVKEVQALDEAHRAAMTQAQTLQSERNEKSKQIGDIKKSGGDAQAVMDAVAAIKDKMTEFEAQAEEKAKKLKEILSSLPNILKDAPEVPDGKDEADNAEIKKWGEPKNPNGANRALEHFEIGEALGMMDFETAAKLSGSRFVLLKSDLARLERALAQFMLDTHTEKNGYEECSPPLLVNSLTMYGTGQLPKFEEDLYRIEIFDSETKNTLTQKVLSNLTQNSKEEIVAMLTAKKAYLGKQEISRDKWLIPTAEVSLTNIVADQIVEGETLPRRYTAYTPCFRSEAGSAGKDTRGMLRQHQFYKVEMVSITRPEESDAEHERMTKCAEGILEALEIPYRTIVLCTGDTGFGARKTYDIEAWLPGQGIYREISSCSTCGDFQARRMNARYKDKGDKNTQYVHTLNGSGLAVGRCLIAVMENYYDPKDGGVFVPKVLQKYMGGQEKIVKAH